MYPKRFHTCLDYTNLWLFSVIIHRNFCLIHYPFLNCISDVRNNYKTKQKKQGRHILLQAHIPGFACKRGEINTKIRRKLLALFSVPPSLNLEVQDYRNLSICLEKEKGIRRCSKKQLFLDHSFVKTEQTSMPQN